MADLREVFEMATKQIEPDQDAWRDQERRQRRTARNRKIGAMAVAAAIVAGVVALAIATLGGNEQRPGTQPTVGPGGSSGAEIVGLDGVALSAVPGIPESAYGLSLSPDGNTVAFSIGDPAFSSRIATIGIDGTGLRYLTGGDVDADLPAWSPDGSRIVYSARVTGASVVHHLYVMDADGANVRQLTDGSDDDERPQWSPDGTTIAYYSGAEKEFAANQEIWTVPAAGGSPTQLTHNHVWDSQPAWSPDGRQIAFNRGAELWVMNADGTDERRIVGGSVWAPHWSPDGKQIVVLHYSDFYGRAYLNFGGRTGTEPLLAVRILNASTGEARAVPGVRVAGDLAVVSWMPSGDALLAIDIPSS